MPSITHARLAKYKAAEKMLRFFQSGHIWTEYSELQKRNRKRGAVIMLLACSLMAATGVIIFITTF